MIEDYIERSCMEFDLEATNKRDALAELSEILLEAGKVTDGEAFLESVLERERLDTTGFGGGFAIPHGKSPVVRQACVAFGRSRAGIEWGSLDDKPVHCIFLLAVPASESEEHLNILSSLARKLMHEDVKTALLAAVDADSLYKALE